jgi:hypothetical protein
MVKRPTRIAMRVCAPVRAGRADEDSQAGGAGAPSSGNV